MTGRGHTAIAETTATGTQQTTSGDVLVAHLEQRRGSAKVQAGARPVVERRQIESATVDGNVVLTQQPPAKAGSAQPALRATAGHADYDNAGQLLHLTQSPRVTDGGLELTRGQVECLAGVRRCVCTGQREGNVDGRCDRAGTGKSVRQQRRQWWHWNFGAQGPTHVRAAGGVAAVDRRSHIQGRMRGSGSRAIRWRLR